MWGLNPLLHPFLSYFDDSVLGCQRQCYKLHRVLRISARHRFGGGQQIEQPWPIQKQPREETAFVTGDMLAKRFLWYGGVSEAYWVSSQGVAVRVRLPASPCYSFRRDYLPGLLNRVVIHYNIVLCRVTGGGADAAVPERPRHQQRYGGR